MLARSANSWLSLVQYLQFRKHYIPLNPVGGSALASEFTQSTQRVVVKKKQPMM